MVDLAGLRRLAGKAVELEFADGHIVRATLISADNHEPNEILYRIIEVVSIGPPELAAVKSGTVATADPGLLKSYRPI